MICKKFQAMSATLGAGAVVSLCAPSASAYVVSATYFNVEEVTLMSADGSAQLFASDSDNDGRIDLDISFLTPSSPAAYPGPYTKVKIKSTGRMGYVCHLLNAAPTQTPSTGGALMPIFVGDDLDGRPVSGVTQFNLSSYGLFSDPGLGVGTPVNLVNGQVSSFDPYSVGNGSLFMSVADLVSASAAGPLAPLSGSVQVGALVQYTIVPAPGALGVLTGVALLAGPRRRAAHR